MTAIHSRLWRVFNCCGGYVDEDGVVDECVGILLWASSREPDPMPIKPLNNLVIDPLLRLVWSWGALFCGDAPCVLAVSVRSHAANCAACLVRRDDRGMAGSWKGAWQPSEPVPWFSRLWHDLDDRRSVGAVVSGILSSGRFD